MIVLLVSLLLAFVLGFSAHRTGICSVSAVAEVMTSGTAKTFLSFLKVVLWVVLITCLAAAFMPELNRPYPTRALSVAVVVGGFVFGLGAGINGGCSFSTISRIAQGDLHVALTLPAFVIGALSCRWLSVDHTLGTDGPGYSLIFSSVPILGLIALALWAVFELVRMFMKAASDGVRAALVSKRYRLSSGAALMGISSGFLYLAHGRWSYSSRLMDYFGGMGRSAVADGSAIGDSAAAVGASTGAASYLLIALFAGAVASALSNRELKWSFAADKWHRNLIGGYVMGFGAMMIPGGNGKLLLHDLPHLSLHAIAAYLALTAGIALVLVIQMRIYGQVDIVSCAGDECRITKV